jgi:hypothetical protein
MVGVLPDSVIEPTDLLAVSRIRQFFEGLGKSRLLFMRCGDARQSPRDLLPRESCDSPTSLMENVGGGDIVGETRIA